MAYRLEDLFPTPNRPNHGFVVMAPRPEAAPARAYRCMLGSRSTIEWIIDRYYIKIDKASRIVNNPNDWPREVGDHRYLLDKLARIVTLSLETMTIVDALPALDILTE